MKLICPRPCQELKLRVAAPHFRIDGRDDYADFPNQVRTHVRGAISVRRVARSAVRIDTVSLDVGRTVTAQTREGATHATFIDAYPWNETIEVQHVVADCRQLAHPCLRKHFTDG